MNSLRLDYCSHEAARYAVMHWHYSRSVPAGKLVKIGVWEFAEFIGCVIFSYGANRNLAKSLKLRQMEVCELTRVALQKGHKAQVSRVLAISLRLLKRQSPGVRVVISYADSDQGHLGVIYQASNWLYVDLIRPPCPHQPRLRQADEEITERCRVQNVRVVNSRDRLV